jgi:hypothetical protein
LIPLGGGTFRLEAKSGGSAVGEVVSFVERGGRVMRIVTGNTFSDRVER